MIPGSVRTRGVTFAYLFGPPRFVKRDEAYKIHGAACAAISCEDLAFQYLNPEANVRGSQAFRLEFQRKEGHGAYTITLDNAGMQAPIRLLLEYTWPPSLEHITQTMDTTSKAVFEHLEGQWQKVLAEVRIRAQCETRENSALEFMKGSVFRLKPEWFNSLGQKLQDLSTKFIVAASPSEDPMENPRRELMIETLKEDRRGLFVELMSQWPQLPEASVPGGGLDLSSVRRIEAPPSAYISEAYEFLRTHLPVNSGMKED